MTKHKLISIDAASRKYGLSWRAMKTLIDQGRIPAYRLGDLIRIDPSELRTAMEAMHSNGQQVKPTVAEEPTRYVPKVSPKVQQVLPTEPAPMAEAPEPPAASKSAAQSDTPHPGWMTRKQLCAHFNLSDGFIDKYLARPDVPKPIAFSSNAIRWNVAELEAWLLAQSGPHRELAKMRSQIGLEAKKQQETK